MSTVSNTTNGSTGDRIIRLCEGESAPDGWEIVEVVEIDEPWYTVIIRLKPFVPYIPPYVPPTPPAPVPYRPWAPPYRIGDPMPWEAPQIWCVVESVGVEGVGSTLTNALGGMERLNFMLYGPEDSCA